MTLSKIEPIEILIIVGCSERKGQLWSLSCLSRQSPKQTVNQQIYNIACSAVECKKSSYFARPKAATTNLIKGFAGCSGNMTNLDPVTCIRSWNAWGINQNNIKTDQISSVESTSTYFMNFWAGCNLQEIITKK